MTRLVWAQAGQRFYETGFDRGVLYLPDGTVASWNGLTALTEDFSGDSTIPYFLDGVKYLDAQTTGDFAGTLTAYTYPDEFLDCIGFETAGNGLYIDEQSTKQFSLAYRSLIGSDTNIEAYKLHLCYNLIAVQDDKTYQSMGAEITPLEFSWKVTGIPEATPGFKPTAHVILDSRYIYSYLLAELEDMLYGNDSTDPSLPSLADLLTLVQSWHLIEVVDNQDGTFTVTGPSSLIVPVDSTTYQINGADVETVDTNTYTLTDTFDPQTQGG